MTKVGSDGSASPGTLLAFGLVTGSVLAAQLAFTRFLASTVGYYFAFVLISLAMLGLAFGSLATYLGLRSLSPGQKTVAAAWGSLAAAVCLHVGLLEAVSLYQGVKRIEDGALASFASLLLLFLAVLPFFLLTGVVVSLLLATSGPRFAMLYGVDLASAAAGCVVALLLLEAGSPSRLLFCVIAPLLAAAAALFALGASRPRLAGGSVATMLVLVVFGYRLTSFEPVGSPRPVGLIGRVRTHSLWNSFSNLSIGPARFLSWGLSPRYDGPRLPMMTILIDGIGASQIVKWDGKPESLASYDYLRQDLNALAHLLLPDDARQIVVGPGGGVDILQAKVHGRRDLTLVEINPLMVEAVNTVVGEFSGRPYFLPGVTLHVENGRTFLRRTHDRWDLISLTWVDSGGNVTALSASENFLYTVEAYQDTLSRLTDRGYFAFMRALGLPGSGDASMDTLRGISVTAEALRRQGAASPGKHVLVAGVESPFFGNRGMCYVLVKRSEFTAAEVATARDFLSRNGFSAIHLPDGSARVEDLPQHWRKRAALVTEILTRTDPRSLYRDADVDIAPTTDDQPFYFIERAGPNRPAGQGLRLLYGCAAFLLVLAVGFLVLPLVPTFRRMPALTPPAWGFLAYCSLLGVSFLLVEMELFQTFALVLGSPAWALGVVLASLLVFSGLGSLASPRLTATRRGIATTFAALAAVLAAFVLGRGQLVDAIITLGLGGRIVATLLSVAPLAFLMGVPMAAGMGLVGDRPLLRLWGWSLNGALSVVASVGALLIAIHSGIAATFALGLLAYVAAGGLLLFVQANRETLPQESA